MSDPEGQNSDTLGNPLPKKGVGFRINTINLIWNMLNMGYQLDIQVKLSKKKMEIE